MTDIIFSFDTEDYVNPKCADGIIRSAELLREYGYRGCYNIVGYMADALVEWGREDIVENLKKYHEIDYHSHRHSHHPTINEITDRADYQGAYEDLRWEESRGIRKVKELFDVGFLPAACPPGNSTSYVAHYLYADLGFPIYDGDEIYDSVRSRPVSTCNIWGTHYNKALENMLFTATEKSLRAYLDEKVATRDLFTFYHHPQRAYGTTFCDIDNFKGVNTPKDQWKETVLHTEEEIETFYKNYRILLELIKNDSRFRVITYKELASRLNDRESRILTRADLPVLRAQLTEKFFPVTAPESYCLADLFHACREFLCGKDEHRCGKVYGFLDTPYAVTEPVTLSASDLIATAKALRADGFLPEYIYVNDQKIGPADWMRAAMAVILDGAETVTVSPDAWQIDLDQFPMYRDLSYKNTWVHCASLEDNFLSKRFRLQSWTIRLPKGTRRTIF